MKVIRSVRLLRRDLLRYLGVTSTELFSFMRSLVLRTHIMICMTAKISIHRVVPVSTFTMDHFFSAGRLDPNAIIPVLCRHQLKRGYTMIPHVQRDGV